MDLDKERDTELIRVENLVRGYDGLPPLPGGPSIKYYGFDHMAYSKRYPELSSLGTSESALKAHWLKTGLEEGKNGTNNDACGEFDPIKYGSLHKDLAGMKADKLKKHYLKQGINEKRIFC
jgi:hypothetical protein